MAQAIAHPNLALIKYWGKTDSHYNLPATPSLSLTLNQLVTTTSVELKSDLTYDQIFLNGKLVKDPKIEKFMNQVRFQANQTAYAVIKTKNNFPTAAGYASSASGFAALSVACNQEFQLGLSPQELACLARNGSGSATRSVAGGLVAWQPGNRKNSFGYQILPASEVPLAVLSFKNNRKPKNISSSKAMEAVRLTSPYYEAWVKTATDDFQQALSLIKNKKWQALLALAENNALKMHATMLSAQPAIIYWEPQTLKLIKQIQQIRHDQKLPVYATIDAGANVKLLTLKTQLPLVKEAFHDQSYVLCLPGKGAEIID